MIVVRGRSWVDRCSRNFEHGELCAQLARHPRNIDFLSAPRIHDDRNVLSRLPYPRPPFFAWRGDIDHIKSCSRCDEVERHPCSPWNPQGSKRKSGSETKGNQEGLGRRLLLKTDSESGRDTR